MKSFIIDTWQGSKYASYLPEIWLTHNEEIALPINFEIFEIQYSNLFERDARKFYGWYLIFELFSHYIMHLYFLMFFNFRSRYLLKISSSFFNFQMMMASRLAMLPEHLPAGLTFIRICLCCYSLLLTCLRCSIYYSYSLK